MKLKFEALGLSKEQAQRVADELCGSAVWHVGHAWVSDTCVVRPQGCQCPYCTRLQNETNSCAKFRIGDDVVVTRWHAPAKVKGFLYELEEPFQYPERERDLSPPAQKASEPLICERCGDDITGKPVHECGGIL